MVGNRVARIHRRNQKRLVCKCLHFCATYYKTSQVPPLGLGESVKPSFLRGLPVTFYLVACLTFLAYVFVWADSHNNVSPRDIDGESGRLIV